MKRRQMLKLFATAAGWTAVVGSPLALLVRRSCAVLRRRLLPADTDLGTLLFENPKYLDPRNLPITPIDKFGTMGLSEHQVDLQHWQLTIGGAVARPSRFRTKPKKTPLRFLSPETLWGKRTIIQEFLAVRRSESPTFFNSRSFQCITIVRWLSFFIEIIEIYYSII
jgi:hypothetical protein